jgi:hypothetical protein
MYLKFVYIYICAAMAANDQHTEVVKAAKMLVSKRKCIVCRCTSLNTVKRWLNRRLSDAWDALTANEKNFYLSGVTYFYKHCQVISFGLVWMFHSWKESMGRTLNYCLMILTCIANWRSFWCVKRSLVLTVIPTMTCVESVWIQEICFH